MADILGRYLQGEAAEGAAIDRQQQESSRRLAQSQLMMNLIRSNAKLKNEDARDLARLEELEPEEGERLLSSVYANTPNAFPDVFSAYTGAQQRRKAAEDKLAFNDLKLMVQQQLLNERRTLQTPSEEEYNAIYAPRYQQFGGEIPPLGGRTYPEIERDLQGRTSYMNAQTQQNRNTTGPKPSALDQPIDPEIVADAAQQYGVKPPPNVTTFREFTAWSKAQTKTKPEPELTPAQSIEKTDEVEDYLFKRAQPKGKTDSKGFINYDEDVNALMAEVASRAIRRGGKNANAAGWEILEKAGWKAGMKGKDARRILNSLGDDVTDEEKADKVRKLLRGEKSQ